MQFIEINTAPALDLSNLIARQKLSATDRKTLDGTVAGIADILEQMAESRPSANGHRSRLQDMADDAERKLAESPTRENREALHGAIVRHQNAEKTFGRINAALSHAARVKIDSLRPIAERILDAVEADLESEGAKRRAEITEADRVFGECGDCSEFDRRLQRTRDFLAIERAAIREAGAALAWLASKDFCPNPYL